ncbi:hypothetical protein [Bradyrhizobium sp. LHD-71]|uniref:hypothetical protein n=1 Tax=Bradyrhizobium sp. LHD-71 TaxID=3072141 RepID=UPI00280E6C8A|nr:hypothetical protein [Bradyrhizobium sp. LHD-71]MDQ8729993.1 hypothetical protein [Bradyrhizobium sp. LHD-71]
MQFNVIPIDAIKAISQRNFAFHWQALHAKTGLPRFADFSPGERAHDPRKMLVWAIDEKDGERCYRPLYGGAYLFEAFGPGASAESIPEPLRGIFRSGLDACVTSASMIYMSIATSDPEGHRVECERLLLPFGDGAAKVTHILASLQVVSLEGTFDRHNIVEYFEKEVNVTLCGRILPASRSVLGPSERLGWSQSA